MLIKLSFLRRLIREAMTKSTGVFAPTDDDERVPGHLSSELPSSASLEDELDEDAWVPGRWNPTTGEPMSPDEMDRLNQPNGQDLDEVDTDPTNNPGRPADAFEYLGMRPDPKAAMSPPSLGGGTGGEEGDSSSDADPSAPPDEPTDGE